MRFIFMFIFMACRYNTIHLFKRVFQNSKTCYRCNKSFFKWIPQILMDTITSYRGLSSFRLVFLTSGVILQITLFLSSNHQNKDQTEPTGSVTGAQIQHYYFYKPLCSPFYWSKRLRVSLCVPFLKSSLVQN